MPVDSCGRRSQILGMMKWFAFLFCICGLFGIGVYAQSSAEPPDQIQACSSCHGTSGISVDRFTPNLAGQLKNYMFGQLQVFKNKQRASPDSRNVMQIFAGALSEADMQIVSEYFSSQPGPVEPVAEDVSMVESGRLIYESGIVEKGVPACIACHGPTGLGFKSTPRLAGQHASYIVNQFRWFQSGDRPSQSSMPQTAQLMTAEEIRAVANYLQSLKEDPNSEL